MVGNLYLGNVQPLADMADSGGIHNHGLETGWFICFQLIDGHKLRPVLIASGEMADQIPKGKNIQIGELLRFGRADSF